MQKNIDSVDLESGKGCLIPILVCNFFRFSKNNLVSERKKKPKQGDGQSYFIALQYIILLCGISISQIRKLKSVRERGQCTTKTKRDFCSGSQG